MHESPLGKFNDDNVRGVITFSYSTPRLLLITPSLLSHYALSPHVSITRNISIPNAHTRARARDLLICLTIYKSLE